MGGGPDTALKWILYSSLLLSWAVVLYSLCGCIRSWYKREKWAAASWGIALALIAAVVLPALFLSPRGGYDNEHDIMMLSSRFFPPALPGPMTFKEISPLFTDQVSDLVSGRSLNAILWKNRLLQGLSVFVFFLGIRRLGAGLAVALSCAAFLGFNFLTLLNANTFSSTSSNMFIWLVSLLALAETFAARELGAGVLAWAGSSIVLLAGARYEFVPVNVLILCVVLALREMTGAREWRRPLNLAILGCSAVLLAAWAFVLPGVGASPFSQVGRELQPLTNFLYQLGDRNFGMFAGSGRTLAAVFAAVSCVLGLAGGFLERRRFPDAVAALTVLAVWAVYFALIFKPMDQYPLHFMRHQLYFFVPFAYLFALGLAGLEKGWEAIRPSGALFPALCLVFLFFYGALNLRAAFKLNPEVRTNDRELQFLAAARAAWPPDGELLVYDSDEHITVLLKKYFPVFNACGAWPGKNILKYRPARDQVFFSRRGTCQERARGQYAGFGADAGVPFREIVFPHRFYTCWEDAEFRDAREVRLGFYPVVSNKDEAWLLASRASCMLRAGRAEEAGGLFQRAVDLFPQCGNCRYGLASSLLLRGRGKEAGEELSRAVRALPECGAPRYLRAFGLARAGDISGAEAEVEGLVSSGPDKTLLGLACDLRSALNYGERGPKARPSVSLQGKGQ